MKTEVGIKPLIQLFWFLPPQSPSTLAHISNNLLQRFVQNRLCSCNSGRSEWTQLCRLPARLEMEGWKQLWVEKGIDRGNPFIYFLHLR